MKINISVIEKIKPTYERTSVKQTGVGLNGSKPDVNILKSEMCLEIKREKNIGVCKWCNALYKQCKRTRGKLKPVK